MPAKGAIAPLMSDLTLAGANPVRRWANMTEMDNNIYFKIQRFFFFPALDVKSLFKWKPHK